MEGSLPVSVVLARGGDHQPKVLPENLVHRHTLRTRTTCPTHSDRYTRGCIQVSDLYRVRPIIPYIGPCRENSRLEREIILPTPTRANIFSVPLEDLMGYDGEKDGIPRVIKDSIQYLRETGACFPRLSSYLVT